jgi:hypothetical protein
LQVAGSNLRQTLGAFTDKQKEFLDLAKTVQPLSIPSISKAARERKLSNFYSQRTLRQLAASLREKGVLIQKVDQEGKPEKTYHGAIVYEIAPGSDESVSFDNEKIILSASAVLQACEYVSPAAYVAAINSEEEITADSGAAAIVTAPPSTTAKSGSDTMAASGMEGAA